MKPAVRPGGFSIHAATAGKSENKVWQKLFLKLIGGYGLVTPGSYTVSSKNQFAWTESDGNSFTNLDTLVKTQARKGLGYGLQGGLGLGYIQNDFLNFGLDIVYVPGKGVKNSLRTFVRNSVYEEASDELEYALVTLTPHAIFKALAKPKYFLYNKLGVLLTVPFTLKTKGNSRSSELSEFPHSFVFIDNVYYPDVLFSILGEEASTYSTDYKMSLGVGVNIAFGINFRVNNKTRAFAEIFGNYSALTPSSFISSSYTISQSLSIIDSTNFHLEMASKTIANTSGHTTYKRGGVVGITGSQYEDLGIDAEGYRQIRATVRGTAQKYVINMSTLGINVGLVYRF